MVHPLMTPACLTQHEEESSLFIAVPDWHEEGKKVILLPQAIECPSWGYTSVGSSPLVKIWGCIARYSF